MTNTLKTISKTEDHLRVGNHIVLWGGTDLTGERFTPDTDFNSPWTRKNAVPVDWEHGLDTDPESPKRDDVLGWVDWKTAKATDLGLWVERVLDRRNDYIGFLEQLIEEGMIGTSSEATQEARRTVDGEIQVWPIKRDALTVQPAEPRMMSANALSSLKHLAEHVPSLKAYIPQETGEVSGDATGGDAELEKPKKERTRANRGVKMTDKTYSAEEVLELIQAGSDAPPEDRKQIPDALKSVEDRQTQLDETMAAMVEVIDNLKTSPAAKDIGFISPDSEEDRPEAKSLADFMYAVRVGNVKRLKTVYKAAMAENAGPTGGWMVPVELAQPIEHQINELSVLRAAGARVIPMGSKEIELPVHDVETAPSAGDTSYAGGARAYWTSEAGSITESEPTLKLIRLVAHKLAAYSLASMEVTEDSIGAIAAWLSTSFARAMASQENYQFFRGDGVGKPRGIYESGAVIDGTRSAASAVALADLGQMMSDFLPESWRTGAWFANPDVFKKLIQLADDPLSWLTSVRDGLPPQLLGMPLYLSGALPALNTAGDIALVDPDWYAIGDRGGISVAFSEHFKFQNDQGAYRATKRVDGQPLVESSITLENASTTVSPFVRLAAG